MFSYEEFKQAIERRVTVVMDKFNNQEITRTETLVSLSEIGYVVQSLSDTVQDETLAENLWIVKGKVDDIIDELF